MGNQLTRARSVAYSTSAGGVYLSKELFQRLDTAEQERGKSMVVDSALVGAVVARGEAAIFQQVSDLPSVSGIDYVGLARSSTAVAVNCCSPAHTAARSARQRRYERAQGA